MLFTLLAFRWVVAGGVSQLTVGGLSGGCVVSVGCEAQAAGGVAQLACASGESSSPVNGRVVLPRVGRYFAHRWVAAGGVTQLTVGW